MNAPRTPTERLLRAAQAVVLSAKKITPEIADLNRAILAAAAPTSDRVLLFLDGTVDEIVSGDVHLEKMDRDWAYLGAGKAQFAVRATGKGRLIVEPYQGTNLSQFLVETEGDGG